MRTALRILAVIQVLSLPCTAAAIMPAHVTSISPEKGEVLEGTNEASARGVEP